MGPCVGMDEREGFAPVPADAAGSAPQADPVPAAEPGPRYDEVPSQEDRNLAVLAHLSPIAGLIGIPLGTVLGPLVVWLVTKDRSPFLDDQGKEALNFQIAVLIAGVVLGAILFVSIALGILILPLFVAVLAGVALAGLAVFVIIAMVMAAMKAHAGVAYRYPVRITFVK